MSDSTFIVKQREEPKCSNCLALMAESPAKSAIPRLQDLQEDDFITLRHSAAEALQKIRQALPLRE